MSSPMSIVSTDPADDDSSSDNEPPYYLQYLVSCKEFLDKPSVEGLLTCCRDYGNFVDDVAERENHEGLTPYSDKVKNRLELAQRLSSKPLAEQQRYMFPMNYDDLSNDIVRSLTFHTDLHATVHAMGRSLNIGRLSERFCATGLLPPFTGDPGVTSRQLAEARQDSLAPNIEAVLLVAQEWNGLLRDRERYYFSSPSERETLDLDAFDHFKRVYSAVTAIRTVSQLAEAYWYRQYVAGPTDARVIFYHPNKLVAEDAWTAARFTLETLLPRSQLNRDPMPAWYMLNKQLEPEERKPGVTSRMTQFEAESDIRQSKFLDTLRRDLDTLTAATAADSERVLREASTRGSRLLQEARETWAEMAKERDKGWPLCSLDSDRDEDYHGPTDIDMYGTPELVNIPYEPHQRGINFIRCNYD